MIKEIYFFFRYGPAVQKRKNELGLVEFMKAIARDLDADGFAELRTSLVGDLEGEILEIGSGTGATFHYYGPKANVTAIEPSDEFRAASEEAAESAAANIRIISGTGEKLPFPDAAFEVVTTSMALCSVASPSRTLTEFKRVLQPGGQLRLLEHVRSEHWLAGPLLDIFNPIWIRLNDVGCNWNRKTVETVRQAGFTIHSIENHKIYSKTVPATFPLRVIKAEQPM